MAMSESSFKSLRMFRASVQQVIKTVGKNEPFYLADGKRKPTWDDLFYVTGILGGCRRKSQYRQGTHMHMIASSIERAAETLRGEGKLANIVGVQHHLSYILNDKTSGGYRYQAELLSFLGRLKNGLDSKISYVRRIQKEKK